MLPSTAVALPIVGAPDYHPVQPPLAMVAAGSRVSHNVVAAEGADQKIFLNPLSSVKWLDIWVQCYYRWLPIVEIPNGGMPQVELFHRVILSHICKLQQALQTGEIEDLPQQNAPPSRSWRSEERR